MSIESMFYLTIVSLSSPSLFAFQSLRRGHRCKICDVVLGKGILRCDTKCTGNRKTGTPRRAVLSRSVVSVSLRLCGLS